MPKLIGAAAIILNSEGDVLLVKHSYGKNNWDLPGGKGEENESAEETATREVHEEVGIVVGVGELTGIYYDPNHDIHHFVFIGNNDNNQIPHPSSPEILACKFWPRDELPRPISDFTCKRIEDAFKPERKQLFHTIGPRQWIE
ncbi:NUDIX domain-containing protein [Paenibacillus sp. 5J-6]|uniref:NUDIX domain-containing protein n=1 Tax=Paenibacillus silvestris TaxID=2606219 RepID=A0A6L8UT65_9BACL|nr:NUDIX domain-containing protein [Paenibacillus silvestris]MZQ81318.1 NUDIX domain-containing protein [Paenibacillus silvestris]